MSTAATRARRGLLTIFLFATVTASAPVMAVVVGNTRATNAGAQSDHSIAELRNQYKRPQLIAFPSDNPYTPQKTQLGKKLYFDTRLSGGNVLACATCHNPGYGWGDGQPKGIGHGMNVLGRRSPTIINAAYLQILMWDGRAASLEAQALGPIQADVEMHLPLDQLMARLKSIAEYGPLFESAFGQKDIQPSMVAQAIATFERTVVSGRAPFDQWIDGDEKAMSEEAKHGFVTFNTKARCAECHSSWRFTDDSFHDIGLPSDDIGRGKFLPDVIKMQHAFKTPGLREISRRAPYMHDGSIPTLEAVVDHYAKGGVDRPSRSDVMKPLQLSTQEKADLVAFMNALTSDVGPISVPMLPR
jgi:cytochrome c peroxidase